jgi:hypothetical protein
MSEKRRLCHSILLLDKSIFSMPPEEQVLPEPSPHRLQLRHVCRLLNAYGPYTAVRLVTRYEQLISEARASRAVEHARNTKNRRAALPAGEPTFSLLFFSWRSLSYRTFSHKPSMSPPQIKIGPLMYAVHPGGQGKNHAALETTLFIAIPVKS